MKAKHIMVLIAMCGLAAASIGVTVNTAGVFYAPVAEDLVGVGACGGLASPSGGGVSSVSRPLLTEGVSVNAHPFRLARFALSTAPPQGEPSAYPQEHFSAIFV